MKYGRLNAIYTNTSIMGMAHTIAKELKPANIRL